jgi:hypothetical protein
MNRLSSTSHCYAAAAMGIVLQFGRAATPFKKLQL